MRVTLTLFFALLTFTGLRAQTDVIFYTTEGEFTVEIREDLVPITGGNFLGLVETEFYDGIIFHRVIDNFVIQGGDPTGTGFGGSGVTIPDEFTDSLSNVVRSISMANSGPNTGTSQFFINLVNNTYLDHDNPPLTSAHPVFGMVTDGWPTVQAIGDVPVDGSDRPITDVVMDSLRIVAPPSTSIHELAANIRGYSLNQNPVTTASLLTVELDNAESIQIYAVDLTGATVVQPHSFQMIPGENQVALQPFGLLNLPAGNYFLMLQGDKGDLRALPFVR